MADTYSTSFEFRLQTIGGNNNNWGTFLNTNFTNIDTALGGVQSISLASADVTLSETQNRYPITLLTGTIPANRNLIVKTQTKRFWVYNGTSGAFTVTIKTAAGAGVEVTQGNWALVYCDGTNVEEILEVGDLASLDQVAAGQIASDAVTTAKILDSNVTLAKLANIAAATILGNNTAGAAAPIALTATQAAAVLPAMVGDSGSGGTKGLVPAPDVGDAVKALAGNGDFVLAEAIDATKDVTGTDGYVKLPGGVILQWGRISTTEDDNVTVTFPFEFPNACLNVGCTNESNNAINAGFVVGGLSTTSFIFNRSNDMDGTSTHYWQAIGY